MLKYVDREDLFYLIVHKESTHAGHCTKPPVIEATLHSISRARGQIPVRNQIPIVNQSSRELSEGFLLCLLLDFLNSNGNTV